MPFKGTVDEILSDSPFHYARKQFTHMFTQHLCRSLWRVLNSIRNSPFFFKETAIIHFQEKNIFLKVACLKGTIVNGKNPPNR